MQIAIAEAKSHFAELVRKAEQGEDIVLTRYGKAVARIVATVPEQKRSLIGCLKGQIVISDDFEDPLPEELLATFEGSADPS
jgi:prevent-host-death family protein